jgi:hypothetical protein
MATRRSLPVIFVWLTSLMGAAYPTQNFMIEAPNIQIAQQIGQAAEYYRREKAILWLGQEMPPWPERCPVRVTVTMSGPGGATSFAFDRGRVLGQHMNIEGPLDRLLSSVLPHEVTHTVFAYYFRQPLPRWADEGGAVLSEDQLERDRHDQLVRHILNTPGREIPLRRLFALQDYPGDVMCLYAEGYSVADFLIASSNRQQFLGFIATGMSYGWDQAVRSYYRYNSVEELEGAWLAHLRATKRMPVQLAQNTDPNHSVMIRRTVPPGLPTAQAPIYRGQADDSESQGSVLTSRPGYLPDYQNMSGAAPQGTTRVPRISLGVPQPLPVTPAQPVPYPPPPVRTNTSGSPVGYPQP